MRTAKNYVAYRTGMFGPIYWTGAGYDTRNIAQAQRMTLRQAQALRNRIDKQARGLYGYAALDAAGEDK